MTASFGGEPGGEPPWTGSEVYETLRETCARPAAQSLPGEWAKLIRKLRWIGLEDDARCSLR
jgi:hypothetical protein